MCSVTKDKCWMSFQHPLGYLPETVSNGESFCHSVYGKYAPVTLTLFIFKVSYEGKNAF